MLGGRVGMLMALNNPALIEKLIVVDVAPTPYPPLLSFARYIEYMEAMDLKKIKSRREADEFLQQHLPAIWIATISIDQSGPDPTGKNTYSWRPNLKTLSRCLAPLRDFPTKEGMVFGGKTLFIAGETSDYVKRSDIKTIESYFPQSSLEFVSNAGHWVHADRPEDFLRILLNFLKTKELLEGHRPLVPQ